MKYILAFYLTAMTILLDLDSAHLYANSLPSTSIFWLDSKWVNQDGEKMTLKDYLQGQTSIVSMIFLSCSYTCPLTIQDMKIIDEKIQKKRKSNYKMVLISIDPEKDTPSAMKAFMKERNLDPSRWILLSSSSENIRSFAAALGFSYKRDKAMEFAHSMLTWIFDSLGDRKFTRTARQETIEDTAQKALSMIKP